MVGITTKKSNNAPEEQQQSQQNEEQSQSQSQQQTLDFISPASNTVWPLGTTQTITLKNAPVNDSHCSNNFSLLDQNDNIVGYIGMSTKGNPSISWNTSSLADISCGTGASPVSVTAGIYKIRFSELDTTNGTGPAIQVDSDYFTIQ